MYFVRGLIYPNPNSGGRGLPWRMKWMYEFWGFCINSPASPTAAAGFAANNGIGCPVNFTGGTSLLASGSDGSHTAVTGNAVSGDCIFTTNSSAPFTAGMAGLALVLWVPGSGSSMDSVYLISRVISANQVVINVNTGGTPDPVTKHPTMSARSNVNYRVVDMVAGANALTTATFGSYLVFNLNASSINPGQGNAQGQSQVILGISVANSTGIGGNSAASDIYLGSSGSGTWNGSTLTVSGATNTTPITITTTTPHNLNSGQIVAIQGVLGNYFANGIWQISVTGSTTFTLTGPYQSTGVANYTGGGTVYNGFASDGYQGVQYLSNNSNAAYTAGQTCVNLIGDPTFLITHIREQDLFQSNLRTALYFEIPTRLYPVGADTHPVAMMIETVNTGSLYTSNSGLSYGGGWFLRSHESDSGGNTNGPGMRNYRTLVKALRGDGTPDVFGQNLSNYLIGFNTVAGTVPQSAGVLGLPGVPGQYCLTRCQLRSCIFTGTHIPSYHRIGTNGSFIQIQNGICWPWDNTIIPQVLLFYGSG